MSSSSSSTYGGLAGLPVSGADLAVLLHKLERLEQTQRLIDRAANGQVVHGDLAQILLGVNQEQTTARKQMLTSI